MTSVATQLRIVLGHLDPVRKQVMRASSVNGERPTKRNAEKITNSLFLEQLKLRKVAGFVDHYHGHLQRAIQTAKQIEGLLLSYRSHIGTRVNINYIYN